MPINLIISLLLMISIIAIIIFIQVKLSRKKNKYLGLIMPIISFLFSFYIIFTSFSHGTVDQTGGKAEYLGIFFTFLISNIPTVLLAGIYLNERNKIKINKSIKKMKINDL